MTVDEFLTQVQKKSPPAPADQLAAFEVAIGDRLPEDYRYFLINCNGGYVGGRYWYREPTPNGREGVAGVNHIGGFRAECHFSLTWTRECYEARIPKALIWIMDDPFGNAICLGIESAHRGRVYFWDHENEPDEDEWNGEVESAGNVRLLADSFTDFVAGLRELDDDD